MASSLGGANAPLGSNNWFYGEVINHQGTGWCTQTLYDFAGGAAIVPVWRRAQQNGTWGQWYRLREEGVLAYRAVTGTTDTLTYADMGGVIEFQSGSATTCTLPPNSSVPFPIDTIVNLFQYGAGQVTVAAGAGVTIRSAGSRLKLTGQYSAASLRKRVTDEWWLFGDIAT